MKRNENSGTPLVEAPENMMFFTRYDPIEFFINFPMTGINAAVADHFIMFFRNVSDKATYEIHDRNGLLYVGIIFVPIIMKSDKVTIIFINSGGGNYGASKIASNVFDDFFRVTFVGLGINIENILMFIVTEGFYLFKRWTEFGLHFIQ